MTFGWRSGRGRRCGGWRDEDLLDAERGGFARMGRRHRRAGLRRFFAHGDLRFLILKLIDEKPRHGYEIIKAIEDGLAGAYAPSPGVVYPTLTLLEELGWARAVASDDARNRYEITEEGQAALAANRATVDAIMARMAEVSVAQAAEVRPEVRAAVDRLRRAVLLRMAQGPLSPDDVSAIVAAIDAAVVAIETEA